MTPDPQIIKSIKKLDYRVTVGDVAAQAGLDINFAQQGLLALAADAGGHLQVAESGDVVYLFPKNFLGILRNKYWQLRWQQWWGKVWNILFYLIRISFGIILIASILLMVVAIIAIAIAASSSQDEDNRGGGGYRGGGGSIFMPRFWIGPDIFWWFNPGYRSRRRSIAPAPGKDNQLNFLEAVYSFLFGDGNPNADLEENRFATIGQTIKNNQGAVIAEQIAPYIDQVDQDEDYMIPVLSRFNGYPEVSPQGEIIYYFPELQVAASSRQKSYVPKFLQEQLWQFSQASSGQKIMAIGLGGVNIILALVLGSLLQDPEVAIQLGGLVAFVNSIFGVLVAYGVSFLAIPLVRNFWLQGQNSKIAQRNQARESRVNLLQQASSSLQQKLAFAQQFNQEKVISDRDLAYTTEDDLLDQNIQNTDKIDAQWQKRLDSNVAEDQ